MDMDGPLDDADNQSNSAENNDAEIEIPGAYVLPFAVEGQHGRRLDSLTDECRAWAVRYLARYDEFIEANGRYEEWLFQKRGPGEFLMPFGEYKGKRLDAVPDSLRYWAIQPERASNGWYALFVKENGRYEEHLAMTRPAGEFPFPWGKYKGLLLQEVPQDNVWWALHPKHQTHSWYERLEDANKRYLDEVYSQRSPGSELIWFGKRYKGYRLDQVYRRPRFIEFCLDPEKKFYWRLKDLIDRYEAHLKGSRANQRPRAQHQPHVVQNPCGEAIGPWDDDPGSARGTDNEYEPDDFVVSDSDEIEYESGVDEDNDSQTDNDDEYEAGSDVRSDYEAATDFIENGDEDITEQNVDQQKLSDIDDDMPLDELQRSLKKHKSAYQQAEESDGWDSPSPSSRKLTRLKKKPSPDM